MELTYAIPDLHGRLDLFEAALSEIDAHRSGRSARIVTLGDYVDRGPASRQLIERLMTGHHGELPLICLKGNHEAMMWQACKGLLEPDHWLSNGGAATLASYGAPVEELRKAVPEHHLVWLDNLALMHVDRHRVFVHAAVDPEVSLAQQNEQVLLWRRYPPGLDRGHGRRYVVHGHHATPSAPVIGRGKTNLDGLAWRTGRLVIGVYDDAAPGSAIDYLNVTGAPSAVD